MSPGMLGSSLDSRGRLGRGSLGRESRGSLGRGSLDLGPSPALASITRSPALASLTIVREEVVVIVMVSRRSLAHVSPQPYRRRRLGDLLLTRQQTLKQTNQKYETTHRSSKTNPAYVRIQNPRDQKRAKLRSRKTIPGDPAPADHQEHLQQEEPGHPGRWHQHHQVQVRRPRRPRRHEPRGPGHHHRADRPEAEAGRNRRHASGQPKNKTITTVSRNQSRLDRISKTRSHQ